MEPSSPLLPQRSTFELELAAAAVGLASLAGFFVVSAAGLDTPRLLLKPWPVLALAALAHLRSSRTSRPFVVGLLVGAVGDVLLETGEASHFVPGLLAFLVGHLAYVVAFVRERRELLLLRAVPFALFGALVLGVCLPGAGALRPPIAAYGAVLAVMLWRAAARLREGGPLRLWWGLVGAMSFAFSDALIAVTRFVHPVEGSLPVILLTYWLGQALLTFSLPPRGPDAVSA